MCERRVVERECFDRYVVYLCVVCEMCLTLCGVYCVLIDENAVIVNVSVLPFARYVSNPLLFGYTLRLVDKTKSKEMRFAFFMHRLEASVNDCVIDNSPSATTTDANTLTTSTMCDLGAHFERFRLIRAVSLIPIATT